MIARIFNRKPRNNRDAELVRLADAVYGGVRLFMTRPRVTRQSSRAGNDFRLVGHQEVYSTPEWRHRRVNHAKGNN